MDKSPRHGKTEKTREITLKRKIDGTQNFDKTDVEMEKIWV